MSRHSVARATIVIPQFNRADLTCACLRSLRQRETCPVDVVVVDDGSDPAAPRAVRSQRFPRTRVITQNHTGLSAAWNRGAAVVETPYVVFLNNDTVIRGPFVERLLERLKRSEALMTGVLMRREEAVPSELLVKLPSRDFLQGWCFAVSHFALCRLGGFDESMALYFSDTDLQCRLLRLYNTGNERLAALSDLPLVHLAHRTVRDLADRQGRWQADRRAFIRKWRLLAR